VFLLFAILGGFDGRGGCEAFGVVVRYYRYGRSRALVDEDVI